MQNKYVDNLYARLQIDLEHFEDKHEPSNETPQTSLSQFQIFYLQLLESQRKLLHDMNRNAEFHEEVIRKYLGLIDLEEFKIREKMLGEKTEGV